MDINTFFSLFKTIQDDNFKCFITSKIDKSIEELTIEYSPSNFLDVYDKFLCFIAYDKLNNTIKYSLGDIGLRYSDIFEYPHFINRMQNNNLIYELNIDNTNVYNNCVIVNNFINNKIQQFFFYKNRVN